jgi:hypothetical protein
MALANFFKLEFAVTFYVGDLLEGGEGLEVSRADVSFEFDPVFFKSFPCVCKFV